VALVYGPRNLEITLAGTSFAVSPNAFFQTNTAAANVLVSLVNSASTDGMSELDLKNSVRFCSIAKL
jgi:tRNA/tmRNA/rRNA uracil-C5-methylase (TrmA/RlmC/RlmD family)